MGKNIRVGFDDLQPGDKVHLKGSNNVYKLIRKYGLNGTADDTLVVSAPGILQVAMSRIMFDYATRPAPKKPKLRKPVEFGEYWIHSSVFGWRKMLYRASIGDDYTIFVPYHIVTESLFSKVLARFQPTEILTAEEYYTRKIKGEL